MIRESVLDGVGAALVDAGTAVGALGGVDDGNVVDGDGTGGADVGAEAAGDTVISDDCGHFISLRYSTVLLAI